LTILIFAKDYKLRGFTVGSSAELLETFQTYLDKAIEIYHP